MNSVEFDLWRFKKRTKSMYLHTYLYIVLNISLCSSYLMNFRSESLKLKANPNSWQILGREKLFSLILPICNRENGCHSSWYFWQGSQTNNWSLIKLPWFSLFYSYAAIGNGKGARQIRSVHQTWAFCFYVNLSIFILIWFSRKKPNIFFYTHHFFSRQNNERTW